MAKHMIIPIFVPHVGCPHDCVFCNQGAITGALRDAYRRMDGAYVRRVVDEHLATVKSQDTVIEVSFYGGTFTGIALQKQKELLAVAKEYKERGAIVGIRLSTRPDYISLKILQHLRSYGVDTIELGVQSLDPEVLRLARRGHGVEAVEQASAWIRAMGFQLGHQLMIGLPGDTMDKNRKTLEQSLAMRPDLVRIYPALVIRDTALESDFQTGTFQPYTLEQAVHVAAFMLDAYEKAGIPVIRMGLQPTAEIRFGGDVVAGPFHPAFRELVEGKRLAERILAFGERKVEVRIGRKDLSKLYADKKRYFRPLLRHMEIRVIHQESAIHDIIEIKPQEVTGHVS